MLDLEPLYRLVSLLPFECLQAGFMQQALVALILLAPMAATMGVQVVSFRMAFFSDAISHSLRGRGARPDLFHQPHVAMPVFGILVGLGIMAVQRNSALSSDTIIGVFFSAVMAFGLAVVSRDNAVARDLQQFLYGDILTITETDIRWLIGLFFALAAFRYGATALVTPRMSQTLTACCPPYSSARRAESLTRTALRTTGRGSRGRQVCSFRSISLTNTRLRRKPAWQRPLRKFTMI